MNEINDNITTKSVSYALYDIHAATNSDIWDDIRYATKDVVNTITWSSTDNVTYNSIDQVMEDE